MPDSRLSDAAGDQGSTAAGQAARDLWQARRRLDAHARDYRDVRGGADAGRIAQARSEWGLSLFQWAEAAAAQAAVEDGHQAAGWASVLPGQPAASDDGEVDAQAARDRRDACWDGYLEARKSGDPALVSQAHRTWAAALFTWVQMFLAAEAAADQRNVAERRRRLDEGMRVHPGDARAGPRPGAADVVYRSRQRVRRAARQREEEWRNPPTS